MDKFICKNNGCFNSCAVSLNVATKAPDHCLMTGEEQEWQKIIDPVKAPEPAAKNEPLPKLTADVFKRPDCPEWARWAAVDSEGNAYWFEKVPYLVKEHDEWEGWSGYWESEGQDRDIPGKYDYGNWENGLIKNPDAKMPIRFKKLHPDAKAPYQATPGSAGWDLTAVSVEPVKEDAFLCRYGTGLAVEIPQGHVGLVFPRSSVYKTGQLLTNCVGVIDSDYRGEITAVFAGTHTGNNAYQPGDRIAQLVIMPIPAVKFVEVEELTETQRGAGGYGSTGK